MKKIISLVIVVLMAMLVIAKPVYADTSVSSDRDITQELEWERITLDGKYAIRTKRFLIDFAEIDMELNTTMSGWENFIVDRIGSSKSKVEIFKFETLGLPLKTYDIVYEAPEANEVLFLSDGVGNWIVDTTGYTDKYMQITLMLDPNASVSLINNVEYWINNYYDNYDFRIYVRYATNIHKTVADLPLTVGNPTQENPGKYGTVEDYFYDGTNNTFYGTVLYYQLYSIAIPNVNFGDDAFLDKVASINYYSIGDEKFFQFDFIDSEEVLLTLSNEYATHWTGFAIWNLTTNELITYNRALALTYIDIEPDRDIYGYLYLPNIPIDNILSVAGYFNYRFGYKNLIQQQKYEDWEQLSFILEKDESSNGNIDGTPGNLPQWSYDTIKYSAIGVGAGLLISLIPGFQPVGFFMLYTGAATALVGGLGGGMIDRAVSGKIDDIETINPDIYLRGKLNTYYTEAAEELIVLPTNVDIHKLYFGSFTKFNSNVVDLDASSLHYSQIVWVTAGQVYELSDEFIDEKSVLDKEDTAPPEDKREPLQVFLDWLKSLLSAIFNKDVQTAIRIAIAVAVVVIVGVIVVQVSKLFKGAKKVLKNPALAIGIGVVILAILFALGYLIF